MVKHLQWTEANEHVLDECLGKNIQEARIRNGLTVNELAKMLNKSISALDKIEAGKGSLSVYQLFIISGILHKSASELLTIDEKCCPAPSKAIAPVYKDAFTKQEYSVLLQREKGLAFSVIGQNEGISLTRARQIYSNAKLTQMNIYLQKIGEFTGITDKQVYELYVSLSNKFDDDRCEIVAYLENEYDCVLAAFREG